MSRETGGRASRPLDAAELARIAAAEREHWWYRGLRDVVLRCLQQPDLRPPAAARILDAGCGTGAVLASLRDELDWRYLGGFDLSPQGLAIAGQAVPEADLYVSDLCQPELRCDGLDVVLSLDVLYTVDRAAGLRGLRTLVEALRPGGLLVLHLPAYRWLRGEHDLAVDTRHRYRRAEVGGLLRELGLEVRRLSYRMAALLPAVAAARLPGILRVRRGRGTPRSDLERSLPAGIDRALFAAVRAENRRVARGVRLPVGSSILAVGARSA